ncbi:hypothetical protein FKP32DRAFT_1672411 [Trametes sanguinea]|nr:hypothetical protein FKP32DRAFT_1672411 [Trametes sanguinea]
MAPRSQHAMTLEACNSDPKNVKVARRRELRRARNRRYQEKLQAEHSNALPPGVKAARRRELRSARNRRYQEKLRGEVSNAAKAAASHTTSVDSEQHAPQIVPTRPSTPASDRATEGTPLRIPSAALDTALRQRLEDLNHSLTTWGYAPDPRAFMLDFHQEFCEVMGGGKVERLAWVDEIETWVLQGDGILDDIQEFIGSGVMASLEAGEVAGVWGEISAVVFKVQYIMAGAECRLDQLQSSS